jgi:LysM repeat protein
MSDEPELSCHYCDNPAEAECHTCGRLYCSEHGDEACLRCMSPESSLPSAVVYRGSLLALVIATAVTVFLLVRPPASKSETNLVRDLPTSTAAVNATATPTGQGGGGATTPRPGPPGPPSATAETTAPPGTTTPGASPTASGQTYRMKAGDTLSAVAASYGVTVDQLLAANPGLNPNAIAVGTEIKIP